VARARAEVIRIKVNEKGFRGPWVHTATDSRSNQNNAQLNSTVNYDGQRWRYQDYGERHFDECFLLAANAGANIITPYTLGQTGDNYWLHSVHMCNTYEWITANGTGMGNDNVGAASRSSRRLCLVGYIDN
jgi:hypothetical protein